MTDQTQGRVVHVGILHSLTGTMALSETSLVDATLMAIREINQGGGVLGRQIEPLIEDGASNVKVFEAKARKLLQQDKVATIFGCWTSLSRKAVLPVFEALNGLLWYPVQYEGLEQSKNIFYTGSCPNQQVEPAVSWLLQHQKKRFYLLGSDYVFPRTANKIIKGQLRKQRGTVVGKDYVPLGSVEFAEIIERIQQAQPDVIFNTLNGDSNLAFYHQFTAAGITAEAIPIMAVSVAEAELQRLGDSAVGHYACWSYFQSIDTPKNRQFVENFQAHYGADRVTSDPIEAAYTQVYLWRQAVELAKSFEVDGVREAAYGQTFEAPGGWIKVERNHHLWKEWQIGQILPNGQFEIIFTSDGLIKPLPWLGVEESQLSTSGIVIDLLAEVPLGIQYSWELEQKSRALETALAQLQSEILERQRLEATLREAATQAAQSTAELQALFAAMSELILIRDAQGCCLKVAPTNPALLFKPAAEMVGTKLDDIFPPTQAETLQGYILQCLETQQTVKFEYSLPIRERETWFAASISPLSENSVIWVARDITEGKRVEEQVQLLLTITQAISKAPDFQAALEVALRQVVEAIGWNYGEAWIPSADGSVLECSPAWYWSGSEDQAIVSALRQFRQHTAAMTFRRGEGLPGRVWQHGQPEWIANVATESDQIFLRVSLAQAAGLELGFGVPIIAPQTQNSQQEEVFAVLVFFVLGSHHQDQRLIEITSAVAAQLGTVLQQKQAEAELRALFAAMDDFIAVFDHQGRCLKVATTNEEILFRLPADQVNKTVHEYLPEALADIHLSYIQQALETRHTLNVEYNLSCGNQEKWFSASVSPLSENTVIWVARDISDRKRAEEEIQLLLTITQAISKAPDFQSALEMALCLVCEATGWHYGEAWIPSADANVLECCPAWYYSRTNMQETVVAHLQRFRHYTTGLTFRLEEGLPGRVSYQGRPEWIADVSAESSDIFFRADIAEACGLKAGFGVPIVVNLESTETSNPQPYPLTANGGRVLAVLVFFMLESRQQDRRLVELVSAVAAQLGAVLQKKQAEEQIYQKNQELLSYIDQVKKVTTAAAAVENDTFQPASLDSVSAHNDELGQLARVFTQMVQTVKAREQELAAAKEQMEAVLNAVPGAISWIGSDGVYLGVNRHLAQSLNLPPEAFIGKEIGFFKNSPEYTQFMQRFLTSSEEAASQEIRVSVNDQERYYLIAAQKYQKGTASVSVGIDITERRRTQEALRQSEEQYRSLISNIPGAIYRCQCDEHWTMEFISDSIAEISGYPASDFIHNQSRTYASVIHPDDRESIKASVYQAVAARQPYILEYRVMHQDGSLHWVYEKGRATFDKNGNLLYLDGAIFDVTDRKRAEEALHQSEATNRALIAAIPDLLIRARRDGTYLEITGQERLTVQNTNQFSVGSRVYDSLPPDKAQLRMHYIQQALATGEIQLYEQRFWGNGQPQDEEVRIVVIGDDEVLIMVRDITARKRAEEALRIAEENYRSIFENALQGIFQSTPDGQYLSVNPAMARMYGYSSPEEMIVSVREIGSQIYVDPSCRSEFKRLMNLCGNVRRLEYQVYRQDESIIWVEENTRAVRDSSGQLLYYEGIVEDITKRKQEEEVLKRQLEELRIEIDQKKREREVAKITQSDYFQELQAEVAELELDEFWQSI